MAAGGAKEASRLNARAICLGKQRGPAVGAAHAAEPAGDYQASGQRPAEVLAGGGGGERS